MRVVRLLPATSTPALADGRRIFRAWRRRVADNPMRRWPLSMRCVVASATNEGVARHKSLQAIGGPHTDENRSMQSISRHHAAALTRAHDVIFNGASSVRTVHSSLAAESSRGGRSIVRAPLASRMFHRIAIDAVIVDAQNLREFPLHAQWLFRTTGRLVPAHYVPEKY